MSVFAFTYIIAGLLCSWALLRCMGNERDRATRDLEVKLRTEDRERAEKEVLSALAAANSANSRQASQPRR